MCLWFTSVKQWHKGISLLKVKCDSATGRQDSLKGTFSLPLLGEKWRRGKEMLTVTPKLGLGKWQAKPKCLTNRRQIELHTAYSESTLCNLNWALCLHLPHINTLLHTVKFTMCIVCVAWIWVLWVMMCEFVWVHVGPYLDTEWIT